MHTHNIALYVKGSGVNTAPRDNRTALAELERREADLFFGDQQELRKKNSENISPEGSDIGMVTTIDNTVRASTTNSVNTRSNCNTTTSISSAQHAGASASGTPNYYAGSTPISTQNNVNRGSAQRHQHQLQTNNILHTVQPTPSPAQMRHRHAPLGGENTDGVPVLSSSSNNKRSPSNDMILNDRTKRSKTTTSTTRNPYNF